MKMNFAPLRSDRASGFSLNVKRHYLRPVRFERKEYYNLTGSRLKPGSSFLQISLSQITFLED